MASSRRKRLGIAKHAADETTDGSGMPSRTSASTPSRMSLPGRENQMRRYLKHGGIALTDGAAVVGTEDQPVVTGSEHCPVVPVRAEVVPVGGGRTPVNKRQDRAGVCPEPCREARFTSLPAWCHRRLSMCAVPLGSANCVKEALQGVMGFALRRSSSESATSTTEDKREVQNACITAKRPSGTGARNLG